MSEMIGAIMPAPLQFEFGIEAAAGEAARATLLATVDADGSPRFAVLSSSQIRATDRRRLVLELHASSTTSANLSERPYAAVWHVLDGAAYTLKGGVTVMEAQGDVQWRRFELAIESVWRDFEPGAPMIAGPTYRAR
jgi:pyridoxine/pyridoxamine 5'-phosphate oxidase